MRTLLALSMMVIGLTAQTMILIPFSGTNDLSVPWWTTADTNSTGVAPWKGWQAANTNFATLQWEFDTVSGLLPTIIGGQVGSSNYLTGNQMMVFSGDVSGTGTTAVVVTTTNIQPPGGGSTGQPLTKTATGVGFGPIAASAVTGLTDADTNAVLNSATWVAASTNWLYVNNSTTNIMAWVLTNFAGVTYTATSGVATVLWSTDSGTTWQSGAETLITNVPVKLAFFAGASWGTTNPSTALNNDIGLTNVVAYSLSRPDLFGRTNQAIGQRMMVGTPVYSGDATPKSYVDAAVAAQWYSAAQDVQLNNFGLHMDSAWNLYSTSSNSALSAVFLGQYSWGVTYPLPTGVTNLITATVASRTNATVKVPTNGLAVAPTLKLSHYLKPLNWSYLSVVPTITGTNYVFTFVIPYADCAFVAAVVPSSTPGVFSIAVNLGVAGSITASNGVASLATNAYSMASTGFTNLSAINVRVIGLTGASIVQSNATATASITRGTITTATDITLQPNECVVGSSMAALKILGW